MTATRIPHVLVVDDEPALCELLTDALEQNGLKVSSAASGRDAVELARRERPDFLVADIRLGDGTGLDVIDALAGQGQDVPAVVITGGCDGRLLSEVTRRHPVELMTKPLNLQHLSRTIREELSRRAGSRRMRDRARRLATLARRYRIEHQATRRQLETTCADLSTAYRTLSGQLGLQRVAMNYQNTLVAARNDDDVFRALFRMFVKFSGPVFGVAMVCDGDAQLRIAGRFGVPLPDALHFCEQIAKPMVDMLLARPQCAVVDAGDMADLFDPSVRPKLPGVSVLAMPLSPAEGELIGVVVLYRKGEQPFSDADCRLADMIVTPTALAVRRND